MSAAKSSARCSDVPYRQKSHRGALGRYRQCRGPDREDQGPERRAVGRAHDDVAVKIEGGQIKVEPRAETKRARAQWGTSRTLIANLIFGVTKGFEQRLEINGVGYRAAVQGKNLQIALGYSHDIVYPIPEGITIAMPQPVEIVITGSDRQKSGRSRPKSATTGRRSPTRARASNMPTNASSARKARRSNAAAR